MLPAKFRFIWLRCFRREDFKKSANQKQELSMGPCLETGRDEMSNVYKEPSIDASYQVSVHLAEGFQRRRLKCEKLTDDRRREPGDGKSSRCLWQGELKSPRCVTANLISNSSLYTHIPKSKSISQIIVK
jgi:hypothetical protein